MSTKTAIIISAVFTLILTPPVSVSAHAERVVRVASLMISTRDSWCITTFNRHGFRADWACFEGQCAASEPVGSRGSAGPTVPLVCRQVASRHEDLQLLPIA